MNPNANFLQFNQIIDIQLIFYSSHFDQYWIDWFVDLSCEIRISITYRALLYTLKRFFHETYFEENQKHFRIQRSDSNHKCWVNLRNEEIMRHINWYLPLKLLVVTRAHWLPWIWSLWSCCQFLFCSVFCFFLIYCIFLYFQMEKK